MSISIRRYMHWQGEASSEPTSTLVLTTPASTFVDIRLLTSTPHVPCLPASVDPASHAALCCDDSSELDSAAMRDGRGHATEHGHASGSGFDSAALHQNPDPDQNHDHDHDHDHNHDHDHEQSHNHDTKNNPNTAKLAWAFAGTTTRRPAPDTAPSAEHVTWHHELDSQHANAHAVIDEAACTPTRVALSDGRVLDGAREVGEMLHPPSGTLRAYEEGWVDLDLPSTSDTAVVAMRTGMPSQSGLAEASGPVGVVVRVGPFVQGVLRRGAAFACERWFLCRRRRAGSRLTTSSEGGWTTGSEGGGTTESEDGGPTMSERSGTAENKGRKSVEGELELDEEGGWACVFSSDGGVGATLRLACAVAMRARVADAQLARVLRLEGTFCAAGVIWAVDEVRGL